MKKKATECKAGYAKNAPRELKNMADKYVLVGGIPRVEHDLEKWARWFSRADRRLKETVLKDVLIVTGFLGIANDYSSGVPVLWETRVYGGKLDGKNYQYPSEKEALEGHEMAVKKAASKQ